MTLFTTAYFPSISYMARFLKEDAPVIEIWETYHKQTYRNRCRVMTANGMESLSVPVVKVNGNHTMTKDMAISPIEPWQHIHSRCLESAYKAAPYFDHYYDYLRPIFEGHFERLIELNDAALQAVLKMLKVKKEIVHTTDYVREVEKELENALGRKVHLVDGKKRGRIELEFYGAEDREKLIENLRLFSSLRRNK